MATAKAWIVETEARMERAEITDQHYDVGMLIRRYREEIGAIKSWNRPYRAGLLRLAKDFDGTTLRDLTAARIVEWGRDLSSFPNCFNPPLHGVHQSVLHCRLRRQSRDNTLVNRPGANEVVNNDRPRLALTMQTLVHLLI